MSNRLNLEIKKPFKQRCLNGLVLFNYLSTSCSSTFLAPFLVVFTVTSCGLMNNKQIIAIKQAPDIHNKTNGKVFFSSQSAKPTV